MSKERMCEMSCGCEFWVGLDAHGELYPEMNYCKTHENQTTVELAELRAKLEHAKDLLDQFASLSAKAEFFLENNPPSRVMTEAEYKDYLSEQDRLKRQEEEQR